jgi:phosphohistidine swiveling domain-containing protein
MSFTSFLGAADDPAALGAKAGNLGRLARLGLPVPPGFVIEASAFAALGALSAQATAAEGAARRAAILAAPLPAGLSAELAECWRQLRPPFIVRSSALGEDSAAASFAGQLDSIFPVAGLAELEDALRRCWASYFSQRCLAYQERGPGKLQGMAVLVQELVPAVFSGVLFTRWSSNAETPLPPTPRGRGEGGEPNREGAAPPPAPASRPSEPEGSGMLGEYCLGYGEALVSGAVDPGRFTLDRRTLAASFEVQLESAPPTETLAELGRLALRCELAFGGPQDIEWCIDGEGRLFLVQARPVTSQAKPERRVLWSNANVNENFPAPVSPLLYSVAATGYSHYFRNLALAFGVSARRIARLEPAFRQIVGVHRGRIYYHLSHIHRILRGVPGGEFLARSFDDFVGAEGGAAEAPPPKTRAWEWLRMAACVFGRYRILRRRVSRFEQRIESFCRAWPIAELARKTPAELRDGLRAFLEIRRHGWNDAALADAAAMVCYGLLGRGLRRLFPDDPGLQHDLLKGLPELVSGHPPRDLWRLARLIESNPRAAALFENAEPAAIVAALASDPALAEISQAFAAYQQRWGFRCSGELMLTQPGLDERPEELALLLRAYLHSDSRSPEELLAGQQESRLSRTAGMLADLRGRRRLLRWPLRALLRSTHVSIELRERARLQQARLYNRLRHLALAIGRAWEEEGRLERKEDVFFFAIDELDQLLAGGALGASHTAAEARQRRQAHDDFCREPPPPDHFALPEGDSWPLAGGAAPEAASAVAQDSYQGIGAGSGRAVGPPRWLREVGEAPLLRRGDVLLTRQTDPGWAAIFPLIAGLVLERGGLLSHGAILAREYGIPCVVGVPRVEELAARGRQLRVDGDRGTVDVLA